jgi:hydrogenase maturation protein HypF
VADGPGGLLLDPRAALRALHHDLASGAPASGVAARFHDAVSIATVTAVTGIADRRGLDTVALGGGVFQNRLLLQSVAAGATGAGLRVLVGERLPPNDGAIAFGQAAVAAARLR